MNPFKTRLLYEIPIQKFIFSSKIHDEKSFIEDLEEASIRFLWFYDNLNFTKKIKGYKISYDKELIKFRLFLCYNGLDLEVRFFWIQLLGRKINQYYNIDKDFFVKYRK